MFGKSSNSHIFKNVLTSLTAMGSDPRITPGTAACSNQEEKSSAENNEKHSLLWDTDPNWLMSHNHCAGIFTVRWAVLQWPTAKVICAKNKTEQNAIIYRSNRLSLSHSCLFYKQSWLQACCTCCISSLQNISAYGRSFISTTILMTWRHHCVKWVLQCKHPLKSWWLGKALVGTPYVHPLYEFSLNFSVSWKLIT